VLMSADQADGLLGDWKRPMRWAGFLAIGTSTRLPRGTAAGLGGGEAKVSEEQLVRSRSG
jgi:hypothetical protein